MDCWQLYSGAANDNDSLRIALLHNTQEPLRTVHGLQRVQELILRRGGSLIQMIGAGVAYLSF